ncbi:MAG: TolC family protein, partial [Planctomycetes bacterium]|nr:TolC family protein [Planctomycetota bacterium]
MNRHACWFATLALAWCSCAGAPPARTGDHGVELPARLAADTRSELPESTARLDDGWWETFADATLDQLVERALHDNRDLRAAAARVEAAAAARTIAGAGALPQADIGLDGTRARRVFVGFPFGGGGVPSTTATTFGLALNLRWELDVWGRIAATESAAIADLQAAVVDHQGARLSLVGQVCKTYFATVEARQQLALARRTADAFRATAEEVTDRYRRGVRPATDVYLATNNLGNAEAAIAQRERQLEQAVRQLEILAGRYPSGRTATASA